MNPDLFFPVLLMAFSVFGWNAFPRRVAQDVAEWEITPQEGRRYVFMYRGWSVAFAIVGALLAVLILTGQ